MSTTDTYALTDLERLALENIARPDPGTPVDPSTATVGQLVVVHSRGSHRLAVIEKVGPKRASVVYTTAGAVKTATDIDAMYAHRTVDAAGIAKTMKSNAAFCARMAEGRPEDYEAKWPTLYGEGGCKDKAHEVAKYQADVARLAEAGGLEATIAAAVEREAARIAHEKTVPWEARITFTRKSVPWANVTTYA